MRLMEDGLGGDRLQDAIRAAQMYYLQDLTMESIAHELQTSRSSISRLLATARKLGIVVIQVASPTDRMSSTAQRIQDTHGINVHIVPVPDAASDIDRLERVALSAARIIMPFVGYNSVIGIAWGSTMSSVSRQLPSKVAHNSLVVQLNGAANSTTTGLNYASEIVGRFGRALGAQVQQFPVPALFDDPATKRALWRERSVLRVLAIQQRMDIAVFGLGAASAAVPSHIYSGGYLNQDELAALARDGVVGDVASVFYRADGSSADILMNERSSGPPLALLISTPKRICVIAGRSKLDALRGALRAGIVTDLIIDEATANALHG